MAENLDVGFQNGSIRLEQIPNVYYSGQIINGTVIFDLRQPLNFSVLYIQYVGEANVLWSESQTETVHGVERETMVKYQSHEEYFNHTETLAGGQGTSQLPRTYHSFPFKFQIPFNAPSSFEGEHGSVSYTITATMVYTDMTREELKKEFKVVAPLDLNNGNPCIKEPTVLEFEEFYSCNCISCYADPVTIRVTLPVTGYCPGQTIPVGIEVDNQSSVEITKMKFELLSKELYRSRQPQSEFILPEEVLATTKRGAVMANSKRNFTCNVVVPDMVVPYLEHCTVIDVGYFIRVTIKLSGCNDELQDETEICLGLVPIRDTVEGEYHHPMADSLPPGPIPVNDGTTQLMVPPAAPIGITGSNISLNRSQQNIAQSASYQNHPPAYVYPSNNAPYPNVNRGQGYPGFGSNTNINRSQQNIAQNSSFNDSPPPYPGVVPYPPQNSQISPSNGQKSSYDIGFKTPERLSAMPHPGGTPYPAAVPHPGGTPYPAAVPHPGGTPYPAAMPNVNASPYPGNLMPGSYPGYPASNVMPQVSTNNIPPYVQGGLAPSAPPPTD